MLRDRALRLRQPHPLVLLVALDVDPAQLRGKTRRGAGLLNRTGALLDRMGWFLGSRALLRAARAGFPGRRGPSAGRRPAAPRARGAAAHERARDLSRRGRGVRAADRPALRARDPGAVSGSLAQEAPPQAASDPAPVRRPGGEPPRARRRVAPRHRLAAVRTRDALDTDGHAGPRESRGRRRLRAAASGKTEISARRRLSAASLLEVRVPDSRANTISSASRNNSKPPNMRNASRLMPMSSRNAAPPSANSSRITADTLTAFSAMRRL